MADPTGDVTRGAGPELRPAMLRKYSQSTLKCYQRRLPHFQRWCRDRGLQPDPEFIDTAKLLAYVGDQIARWDEADDEGYVEPEEYRLLRPETLRQAINALVYWGERAGQVPDTREARELVWRFASSWTRPPAWTVPRRQRQRRAHARNGRTGRSG